MKKYWKAKRFYGSTVPLYVVYGPGLSSMGIAFFEKTDAMSCVIACGSAFEAGRGPK